MKKFLSVCLLVFALLLGGCTDPVILSATEPSKDSTGNIPSGSPPVSSGIDTADLFTDRDHRTEYEESDCTLLTLGSESITISEEGSYLLRGTLDDGQIVVNVDKKDKVQLILDGVSIASSTSAPIYIRQADKVFITLAAGSENSLSNGGTFEAIDSNDIDAVIFSKEDLTLNGEGALTITSPAGHGVVSKDELTITGGTYDITSAAHGICGKDNVCISGGAFTIAAGKDGIHAENNDDDTLGFLYIADGTYRISAEGDGIAASAAAQIDGGSCDIVTGGGSENAAQQTSGGWGNMGGMGGMGGKGGPGSRGGYTGTSFTSNSSEDSTSIKGIKAGHDLVINGGSFIMDCADDAVHSNASITVTNGSFQIATGDDGFHADETLTISGGTISVTESYEGLEGLHVLVSGGDIRLITTDDGINAAGGTDSSGTGGMRGGDRFGGMGGASNGSIVISGGEIYMEASGDGIDANGTLEISGGYTVVTGPTMGDTATLDFDTSAAITGGTFIGTGSSMMAQTFSENTQGVIALSVGSVAAGTELVLTDADDREVVRHTPNLNYAVVILSTPEMVSGETYTITIGSTSGSFEAY